MIKGIYKLRPSLGQYVVTYDPEVVLKYISILLPNRKLMLEMLKKKLCTLLCLLSGQRSQSLQALKTTKLNYSNGTYIFYTNKILKISKRGNHQKALEYREYANNKNLCMVACLK